MDEYHQISAKDYANEKSEPFLKAILIFVNSCFFNVEKMLIKRIILPINALLLLPILLKNVVHL